MADPSTCDVLRALSDPNRLRIIEMLKSVYRMKLLMTFVAIVLVGIIIIGCVLNLIQPLIWV